MEGCQLVYHVYLYKRPVATGFSVVITMLGDCYCPVCVVDGWVELYIASKLKLINQKTLITKTERL